eukprot:Gb_37741 [translate_table: standard]
MARRLKYPKEILGSEDNLSNLQELLMDRKLNLNKQREDVLMRQARVSRFIQSETLNVRSHKSGFLFESKTAGVVTLSSVMGEGPDNQGTNHMLLLRYKESADTEQQEMEIGKIDHKRATAEEVEHIPKGFTTNKNPLVEGTMPAPESTRIADTKYMQQAEGESASVPRLCREAAWRMF